MVGESSYDEFGFNLALSTDGDTLACGAWKDDYNGEEAGSLSVFHFSVELEQWVQVGQTIHGQQAGDRFGNMVDISADGGTVVAGAEGHLEGRGHVRVFIGE